jgi:chemotaxis signal transduction protein
VSSEASELEAFREPEDALATPTESSKSAVSRDLLLFEYDQDLYGIGATCVVGVVPWKVPAIVPGVDARVQGVIQDRGRIVVVMAHPAARVGARPEQEPTRIVVCATARGHIGLPAVATRSVGRVELAVEPVPLSVYESEIGPFIYLDPGRYGDQPTAAIG